MASGKSKYVVADQSTYNNVGATVGQAQQSEEKLAAINNFAATSQQINNSNTVINPTPSIDYQQNVQSINYQQYDNNYNQNAIPQTNYQPENTQQPIIMQESFTQNSYEQPTIFQSYQQQNNTQNINYQYNQMDYSNNDYAPVTNNNPYPNSTPVVNEFIENQTKHISADQLLDDYGLNNTIRAEDDSYNFNIDDQISNSRDIYYNGQTNNNMNEQQIIITHKNLDYKKSKKDKKNKKGKKNDVHTNSFSKGDKFIPPQRTLNNNKPNKFEKKMRRHNLFFNFLLFIIYLLIFSVVGYFGYNYYIEQQQFFFSRETIKMVEGTTFEETIYIKNKVQKNEDYSFKSNDENIATVDKNGIITAITPGKTTIDVISKDEKHTGKIEIEVISLEIKSFKLEQDEKKMYIDNTYTIVPLINGERDIIIDLNWKSSDENILTVSSSGIVTPHNIGIAEVTVSIPNTKYKAKILIQVKK